MIIVKTLKDNYNIINYYDKMSIYILIEYFGGNFMEERKNNLFITEILSRAFNLCIDNFLEILKVIGIFIAPALIAPVIIIFMAFTTALFSSSMYYYSYSYSFLDTIAATIGIGTVLILFLMGIISAVLSLFGSLVITKILDDANKGNEVSWKTATKYVWRKKWSALGLNILVCLMLFVAIIAVMIIAGILSLVTLGIGAIVAVPLVIAAIIIAIPLASLFNSTFLVNDLGAIDAIRETFLLFRKGYFWSTIGRLAAISGISIGLGIVLLMLDFIPIIGFILTLVGQFVITSYISAYLNVFVLDRTKPQVDNFFGNNGDDNSGDSFIDPIV